MNHSCYGIAISSFSCAESSHHFRSCSEDARFVWKRASDTHKQVYLLISRLSHLVAGSIEQSHNAHVAEQRAQGCFCSITAVMEQELPGNSLNSAVCGKVTGGIMLCGIAGRLACLDLLSVEQIFFATCACHCKQATAVCHSACYVCLFQHTASPASSFDRQQL